jgi:hypothetical protein
LAAVHSRKGEGEDTLDGLRNRGFLVHGQRHLSQINPAVADDGHSSTLAGSRP